MIKSLNIKQLLNEDAYIIPIYQRNFAWGYDEIESLLQGMYQAFLRGSEHYYLGSIVVAQRANGTLEVIDGQQRLTAFTLLAHFLHNRFSGSLNMPKTPNIAFEHRENFTQYFSQPEHLPEHFQAANKAFESLWLKQYNQDFVEFIAQKVLVIRTQVPDKTDLNHYFEIMNTRGKQLEKHEILKARLLSRLADLQAAAHKRQAFSAIWDACADMNRYMVLSVPMAQRKKIFGDTYQHLPSNSLAIYQVFEQEKINDDVAFSIEDLLNESKCIGTTQKSETEKSDRFLPVIDFPNFLMHVARIYFERCEDDLACAKSIALDAQSLLETFDVQQWTETQIDDFMLILCQCRYVFDRYIIKTDTHKEQEQHWTLFTVLPQESKSSSYQYNNTFKNENDDVIMLLSMFHVSHPARLYKNWLYAVLRWLQQREQFSSGEYRAFLAQLSDRYYFGHYGDNIDFFELITQEDFVPQAQTMRPEILTAGMQIPNFIFNRLDYLLWKNPNYAEEKKDFRFAFRHSVEHFYPQNPSEHEKLPDEVLHCLGNLCLVSSSINSKFTNNMPAAKLANFERVLPQQSIKLKLMMKHANNWKSEQIKAHQDEMLTVLNTKYTDIQTV